MEDWKRKKSDDEENNRTCLLFNREINTFEERKWHEVKLGDVIKVRENEYFCADLVLINSSEPNGISYVETKNLDGETNLKYRQANSYIADRVKSEYDIPNLTGRMECKQPNEFIYEFDGKYIKPNDNNDIVYIDKNSFLLRGCSLRQTEYIYGFVVYVGHNTKIMKNSPKARSKTSRVEKIMNFQIIIVFCLQTILSVLGAILYIIWLGNNRHALNSYVFVHNHETKHKFIYFFYRIGTWTLIFTNLVPISLLVTLEMIKFIQVCIYVFIFIGDVYLLGYKCI